MTQENMTGIVDTSKEPDTYWQGLPCYDADVPLPLYLTEEDIRQGARGDAFNCALALSAKRQFGASRITQFQRTIAYVEMMVDKKKVVARFQHTPQSEEIVRQYDIHGESLLEEGELKPGAIVVRPPMGSKRLVNKRAYNKMHREKKLQALKEGKFIAPKPNPKAGRRPDPLTLMGVRIGTGTVHYDK